MSDSISLRLVATCDICDNWCYGDDRSQYSINRSNSFNSYDDDSSITLYDDDNEDNEDALDYLELSTNFCFEGKEVTKIRITGKCVSSLMLLVIVFGFFLILLHIGFTAEFYMGFHRR